MKSGTEIQFRNSIAIRYFLATASVLIVGQLVFSLFILYTNFTQQWHDLRQRAIAHVNFLSEVTPDNILANNFYPIETLMQQTATENNFVYSLVTHVDGRALTTYLNGQDPRIQDAVANVTEANVIARANYLVMLDGIVEVEADIIAEDLLIGHVRLGYSTDSLFARLRNNIITTLVLSALLSLLLAVVTILLFNVQIRNPLRNLSSFAQLLAQGQFDIRSDVIGKGEISQLQITFNEMAAQLQDNLDEMEKLSQVASRTKNAVIIADPIGRIEWINDAFYNITGYTLDEARGKTPGSLLQGEKSNPETIEFMRDHLRRGEGFHTEIINYHKSGQEYWIDIEVRPVHDTNGNLKNFIAIETDITERKMSEARIRESESLKSGILETALDAIISIDHEGKIIEFNPAAEATFGHKREDVMGKLMGDIIVPQSLRDGHHAGLQRYLDTREPHVLGQRIELPAKHADGHDFPVEVAITSLEHLENPIFTAHLRDISERKAAQVKLEKFASDMANANWELSIQQARFQSLLRIATQSVDSQTQLEEVVKSGIEAFGMQAGCITHYTGTEFEIQVVEDVNKSFVLPNIYSATDEAGLLNQTFNSSTAITYSQQEVQALCGDNKQFRTYIGVGFSVNGQPYGTLSFMSDDVRLQDFTNSDYDFIQIMAQWVSVTLERQFSRDELSDYADELERSNRELQDFAYISSHDLQEPLRKIQAFGSRVESRYADVLDERGIDYVQRIQNAASRMQTLINDLLSFSRVTTKAKDFQQVDLVKSLDNVLADLEIRISESNSKINIESELPTIAAEPLHMRQLLQNIISNALKFKHPDRNPEVTISSQIQNHNGRDVVILEIADNGIGFDQKYADKIFTIFQRLHGKNEYEGTGIGLAVCRRIVEYHSGKISVTSQEGIGTTFIIELPMEQGK